VARQFWGLFYFLLCDKLSVLVDVPTIARQIGRGADFSPADEGSIPLASNKATLT
jgi:hypothetical protein